MYMELDDQIRLRVTDVRFHRTPTVAELRSAKDGAGDLIGTAANPFAPMQVSAVLTCALCVHMAHLRGSQVFCEQCGKAAHTLH
jgi:hypothetical protein